MSMRKTIKRYAVPHEENNFRPYLLRAAGIVVLLVLIIGAFFGSQIQRLALTASDFLASVLPSVLVDLANADRGANQLASLSINPLLEEVARLKVEDMVSKGYFAHTSPEGITPWYWFSRAKYTFAYAGENLAMNFDDSSAVKTAWLNSPSHRANILNGNFTEVGIAATKGVYQGRETMFVVEMFGRPMPTQTSPASVVTASSLAPSTAAKLPATESGEAVAGSEIAVVPLTPSHIANESESQTFIAVENAEQLVSAVPIAAAGAQSQQYASAFERLITSPTRTLALVYLIISVILLVALLSVLFVRHDRRVRHIVIIFVLFVFLCGLFYAYRAFVQSEVTVLAAFSDLQLS